MRTKLIAAFALTLGVIAGCDAPAPPPPPVVPVVPVTPAPEKGMEPAPVAPATPAPGTDVKPPAEGDKMPK